MGRNLDKCAKFWMFFSLPNGLVAEKQGAAISKSPTLSQTAVGKLRLYHGRARCLRRRDFLSCRVRQLPEDISHCSRARRGSRQQTVRDSSTPVGMTESLHQGAA